MTTGPKNADIRLSGGPGDRQTFSREDWATRILAAHRMGRTTPDAAGWALGYERSPNSTQNKELWVWTGLNCHPVDQVDPQLLRPYGAFMRDQASPTRCAACSFASETAARSATRSRTGTRPSASTATATAPDLTDRLAEALVMLGTVVRRANSGATSGVG